MASKDPRNLTCDAWGRHKMEEVPDDRRYSELRVWKYQIVFQCERCPVRRYVGLDVNGNIGMSRYEYPPDWQKRKRAETPTKASLRVKYAEGRRRQRRRAAS